MGVVKRDIFAENALKRSLQDPPRESASPEKRGVDAGGMGAVEIAGSQVVIGHSILGVARAETSEA